MGYLMFTGCFLFAFSPAIAIFIQLLASNARLIILTIGSSFFWLVSILLASIWWTVIPPLRDVYYWTLIWGILFQEVFRIVFFKLYAKAEDGFIRKRQTSRLTTHPDNFKAAIAFGVGSGVTHSLVSYVTILWEALGPGSIFSPSCPSISLFFISALFSFCFQMFHILWSIVSFDGYRERNYIKMGSVLICHIVVSYLTLLNQSGGSCVAAIVLVFLLLGGYTAYTFFILTRDNSLRNTRGTIQNISHH